MSDDLKLDPSPLRFDEWDGAGNSLLFGLRADHPLTRAGLEHDAEYWLGEKPRYQVTGRFLYAASLDTASAVWDAVSAVALLPFAFVIVPVWDLFRYEQKEKERP